MLRSQLGRHRDSLGLPVRERLSGPWGDVDMRTARCSGRLRELSPGLQTRCHHGSVSELTPIEQFTEAAVDWAGGGPGHVIVDAAAAALAEGLDSPSLRVLAGAPSRFVAQA